MAGRGLSDAPLYSKEALDAWAAALSRRRRSARGEDVTERNSILRLARSRRLPGPPNT